MFALKGPHMKAGNHQPAFPLKHAQKDMKLALLLAGEGLGFRVEGLGSMKLALLLAGEGLGFRV